MRIKALSGVATLRSAVGRAKFTKVNRSDYFNLLTQYDQQALSDKESFDAWELFHTKRGDLIEIRTLHLRKLLEKYDERDKY